MIINQSLVITALEANHLCVKLNRHAALQTVLHGNAVLDTMRLCWVLVYQAKSPHHIASVLFAVGTYGTTAKG